MLGYNGCFKVSDFSGKSYHTRILLKYLHAIGISKIYMQKAIN